MLREAIKNLKNEAKKNTQAQMALEKINSQMPYITLYPEAASIDEVCQYNRIIYNEIQDAKLREKIMA